MNKEKREPYEKPTMVRHFLGLINKFGRVTSASPCRSIDGVAVKDLIDQYGSPLWVVSQWTLMRKYREMQRAFSLRYPNVAIAYSYKANFLSGVCALFHREGAWAEVASGFEYDIALDLGVPGNQIVFNGPCKRREELERAVALGSIVNIDSYDELYTLEELGQERGKPIEVGVRINMELYYPPWNRFGFNFESGQALDACKRVISSECLKLVGLHVHVGTFILDVDIYKQMAEKLVALCHRLQDEPEVKIKYLDVGGGYASRNTLYSQLASGEYTNPTFDRYAESICLPLLRGPFKSQDRPILILEPGRSLVDEGMYLLSSVVAKKSFATGYKMVVIDAGINLVPTCAWYLHDILAAKESSVSESDVLEEVNIYGPLCMPGDCIRMGVSLPPLRKGDILVIKNVGGYNFSQSLQFIQPRPAVVMVGEEGVEYLRLPETTEYIRHLERIPDHLSKKGSQKR